VKQLVKAGGVRRVAVYLLSKSYGVSNAQDRRARLVERGRAPGEREDHVREPEAREREKRDMADIDDDDDEMLL